MIGELLIGGFFSAIGWWSANHYVIKPYWDPKPAIAEKEKQEQQKCTAWEEIKNDDGTVNRTRTCEKDSRLGP